MPDQSANAANIRLSGNYSFETYLTIPTETVIFRALVNQTTFTYPLQTLTFDTVTVGAFGDILVDMEVVIYDQSTSTVKGRLRVANGAATSTVLQVEEFSSGRLSVANNDKIEVLRSWRVRNKIVGATSAFPKDSRIAYTDQGSNPPPICTSGGHWAGFVDDGQVYATVQFTGSNSFNVDPDSGATVTHSWTFPSGTPSSSTSANPSVQFPVGEYWVTHVATDASNSKTTTQYTYVRVYDQTTTRPTEVLVDSLEAERNGGWRLRFTAAGSLSQTQLVDGSLVIIWERENRNGVPSSYGAASSGRSHIKFVGQVVGDSITENAETGTVSFEAVNPMAILAQIPGFSQVLRRRANPTNWRGNKGLTTNRAIIYLLRWHSSILTSFDLVLSADNYNYPALYIQTNTPDAQVREIADGVDGIYTCDRTGRLIVQQNLQYATTAERNAAATTWAFTDQDILDIDLNRNHRFTVGQGEYRGFTAAATVAATRPMIALAPGTAPAEAAGKTVIERLIGTDQADLNLRAGRRYAYDNATYNGLPTSRGRIRLPGSYDIFDLYSEWITLTLSSDYNKRGISFSAARFLVEQISIEYQADTGEKFVTLTIEQECDGATGTTKKVPKVQDTSNPPPGGITPPDVSWPYYPPITPVGDAAGVAGVVALAQASANRRLTTDFNVDPPTWATTAFGTISGTVCGWDVDPSTKGTASVNVIVATTTGIYTVANLFNTPVVTLRHTFGTAVSSAIYRKVIASRYTPGRFGVISYYGSSGGTTWTRSTDYGVNWSENTISTHYNSTTAGAHGGNSRLSGWISEHAPGICYAGAYTATGAAQLATSGLFVSTDDGVNWSTASGMTNFRQTGSGLHFPYHNNPTDRFFYWTKCKTSTTYQLMKTDRDLGTETEVNPIDDGTDHGATWVTTSDIDSNSVIAIPYHISGASFAIGVAKSRDGANNWTTAVEPTNVSGDRYERAFFAANSRDVVALVGEDGLIGYSTDFLTLILDKSIPSIGDTIIRLVGN